MQLKKITILLLTITCGIFAGSPASADYTSPRAKVMLLGLFHFDNPGLDAVKYTPVDVMTPASQTYLEELSVRLAAFKPTRVLLEYNPANEALMNARYRRYLDDDFVLERNEIYQLGFRVAKRAGLETVTSFDERTTPATSDLWSYMPEGAPETMKQFERLIANESARLQREHAGNDLRHVLRQSNSAEEDRANMDFYLFVNSVGAESHTWQGADASADWWRRNFRMYANIQLHAKPGEHVLVIAGSGHTAILRQFLDIDARIDSVDVRPML